MRPRGPGGPTRGGYSRLVCVVVCVQWLLLCVVAGERLSLRPDHQIVLGRCYSYCINTHLLAPDIGTASVETSEETTPVMPRHPIRTCKRHNICRWCLYVCERPEDNFTNSERCLRDCRRFTRTQPRSRGRQACTDACGFVGRASSAKGGTCPLPSSLKGVESVCLNTCRGDSTCGKVEEKCCSNDCGSVCTAPHDVHILPPIPSDISFKMLPNGGVRVKWGAGLGKSDKKTTPSEAVIYILRWWCPYKKGAITSVTDRARSRLQGYPSGIYPGSKCHFMVAAVNVHGSRGFSKVSPYIKKILIPSPPRNLDTSKTTLHAGKIDVTIQWQPPAYTDGLPVHRYQVTLSDNIPPASANYWRLHMRSWTLKPDKTSFVLHNLEPGTSYFLQVRAVVRWKERQKRGKPASTYIDLLRYAPPQQANVNGRTDASPDVDSNMESLIQSVKVNNSFFHDNILKASITWELKPNKSARKFLIFWRLETCANNQHRKAHNRLEISATSHERAFTLYNLQPDCEYAVRVNPVNVRGRTGAATVTNFLTPPCQQVPVLQGTPPTCSTANPPGKVQGLHSETSQCVTVVRWDPPPPPEGAKVRTYDVKWGESKAGTFSRSVVIYISAPRHVSVPANTTQVELGQLAKSQHYTVQVNATSLGGSSPPAVLHLTVPPHDASCAGPGTSAVKGQTATISGSSHNTSSTPEPNRLDPGHVGVNNNSNNHTDVASDVKPSAEDCCNTTDDDSHGRDNISFPSPPPPRDFSSPASRAVSVEQGTDSGRGEGSQLPGDRMTPTTPDSHHTVNTHNQVPSMTSTKLGVGLVSTHSSNSVDTTETSGGSKVVSACSFFVTTLVICVLVSIVS